MGDQVRHDLGQPVPRLGIGQLAIGGEEVVRLGDRELLVEHARAGDAQRLAQVVLGPHRAVVGHARADHGDGLAPQRRVGAMRPRGPVHHVLDLARDGGVVLRGGEQDGVGTLELGAQTLHLGGRSVLAVLVERGEKLETLVDVDRHAVGRHLCGGPQQRRVVRRCAQAAGDSEDPHRARRS